MKIIIRRDLELFRLRQLLLAFEVLVLLSVIMYIAILRGSHLYLFQSCLTMTSIHVNYIWQIQSSKIMNKINVKEWFVKSDFFLLIVKFLKIIMSRQLCCFWLKSENWMNEIQPPIWGFQFLVKTATKRDGLLKVLTQNCFCFSFSLKRFSLILISNKRTRFWCHKHEITSHFPRMSQVTLHKIRRR